ncbi:hypothetical protein ACTFIZ_006296 [Dictyostelium cf. discoideum]
MVGNHYKIFHLDSWREAILVTLPVPKRTNQSLYCFKVGIETEGINVKKTLNEIKSGILCINQQCSTSSSQFLTDYQSEFIEFSFNGNFHSIMVVIIVVVFNNYHSLKRVSFLEKINLYLKFKSNLIKQ